MKRLLSALVLSTLLLGAGGLRAGDFNYSGSYGGSVAGSMMNAMWDFMEWFLGRRYNNWRTPYPGVAPAGWGFPYGRSPGLNPSFDNPYRYRDYWDDPANPWVDMQTLDGTWLAQSGEYWYVRNRRFVLVSGGEQRAAGEFLVEGHFILARLPSGEVEFEFRQMNDVLILRDVAGRVMLLRRVDAGDWSW